MRSIRLTLHQLQHRIRPMISCAEQGWGLLSQFPPFRYVPNFSALLKHTLAVEYHVYVCQVSQQLSCGDTCQIWMWFKEFNRYFRMTENLAYGEINERNFSNPHPRMLGTSKVWLYYKTTTVKQSHKKICTLHPTNWRFVPHFLLIKVWMIDNGQ